MSDSNTQPPSAALKGVRVINLTRTSKLEFGNRRTRVLNISALMWQAAKQTIARPRNTTGPKGGYEFDALKSKSMCEAETAVITQA